MPFENPPWMPVFDAGTGVARQPTTPPITAECPMPQTLDDPISVLSGRGTQTIAPGSPCTGGGAFQDRFERACD
jgi:hypothetical protein